MVEFNNEELLCIGKFEELTGAGVSDCIITESSVIFIVLKGDLGKAIGRKGSNITRVRQAFARPVFVFEDSDQAEHFIRNVFSNVTITNINIYEKMNAKTAYVTVDEKDRGAAIGKGGERVKLGRALLLRKFNCDLKLLSK